MKYKYSVRCVDRTTLTFETTENMDFHTLSDTAISFNDLYINMNNVIYVRKEVVEEEGEES